MIFDEDESLSSEKDESLSSEKDESLSSGKDESLSSGKDGSLSSGKDGSLPSEEDEHLPSEEDERLPSEKETLEEKTLDSLFGESDDNMTTESGNEKPPTPNSIKDTIKEMHIEEINSPRVRGFEPFLLKLPGFMGVDSGAYSEDRLYEEELAAVDSIDDEAAVSEAFLRIATTVRWRQRVVDGKTVKESNSQLVKWSDGSWSLMIGEELFEILLVQGMSHEHNYLYCRHPKEGCMECLGKLSRRFVVRPYIASDQSHRKYLAAAASSLKTSRDVKVKVALTTTDPEREKQRMIKLEQEKIKAKRKLEARKRNLEQRSYSSATKTGLSARFLEEGEDEEEDEYEQDFIDDTEQPEGETDAEHSSDEQDRSATRGDLGEKPKRPRITRIIPDDDDDDDE